MALSSYRATPLPWCNLSPAELLTGRHIRTPLPQRDEKFIPKWPYLSELRKLNQTFKERQEYDFNKRHQVWDLPSLPDDKCLGSFQWWTSSGKSHWTSRHPKIFHLDRFVEIAISSSPCLILIKNNSRTEQAQRPIEATRTIMTWLQTGMPTVGLVKAHAIPPEWLSTLDETGIKLVFQ